MPEAQLIDVVVSDHARMALTSLGADDRRRVHSWFDNLANWKNDRNVRSRARPIPSEPNLYVLRTGGDILLVFRLEKDSIVVESVHREHAVEAFRHAAEVEGP